MISFIFAMDRNRVIGKGNQLPWHLPNDLKFFKETTRGHTVIMGRKTYESIGRPLPDRRNIVLTTRQGYDAPGCEVVHAVEELELHTGEEQFVIGGAEIFKALLPVADRLYVTHIDAEFEGDAFYPEIDPDEWKAVSRTEGAVDEKNKYPHAFVVYKRRK
ncbi:MAG: dihydrofolate reductase [Tumebacillaceae bacterium]